MNHLQNSSEGFSELLVEESIDDLVTHTQNSFEGFSELWIENCVDDGIHTGVDVP